MRIAFRADASLQIGSGHVMRCLTLADELSARGATCHFVCRHHAGHLMDAIRARGYSVVALPDWSNATPESPAHGRDQGLLLQAAGSKELDHANWLGCDWEVDAQETRAAISNLNLDWLIVDHYALDFRWELELARSYKRLMVIDDLADRRHQCDLLLDQNLGRKPADYGELVPKDCQLLTGPNFALLRPEFAALRQYSLNRRDANPVLKHLLVNMGGIDAQNATGQVLALIEGCALPRDCRITVVMGSASPCVSQVRTLAERLPWSTSVVVGIDNMAELMAECDLAIGAVGGTAWERCCLGLPAITIVVADNQRSGADALNAHKATELIPQAAMEGQLTSAIERLSRDGALSEMALDASKLVDGLGVTRLVSVIEELL